MANQEQIRNVPKTIDVDQAFDPEKRHAQADWEAYLATRPEEGNIRNSENGQYISYDDLMQNRRNEYYETSLAEGDYSTESLEQLANRVARARANGDKTLQLDAEQAFRKKFSMYSEKYGWANLEGDNQGRTTIEDRLNRYTEIMSGSATTVAGSASATSERVPTPVSSDDAEADVPAFGPLASPMGPHLTELTPEARDEIVRGETEAPATETETPVTDPEETPAVETPAEAPRALAFMEVPQELKDRLSAAKDRFVAAKLDFERYASVTPIVGSLLATKLPEYKRRKAELEAAQKEWSDAQAAVSAAELRPRIEANKTGEWAGKSADEMKLLAAQMIAMHNLEGINAVESMSASYLDKIIGERGKLRRFSAKVGKWFTGDKNTKGITKWLRGGGTGAAVGAGMMLAGAGWPITTAVGMGLGTIVRATSKDALIAAHEGEERAFDLNDEHIQALIRGTSLNGDSITNMINLSAEKWAENSQLDSNARQVALKKGMGAAGMHFGVGMAAGALLGGVAHGVNGAFNHGGNHVSGATDTAAATNDTGSNAIHIGDTASAADASQSASETAGTVLHNAGNEVVQTAGIDHLNGTEINIHYGDGITQVMDRWLFDNGYGDMSPEAVYSMYQDAITTLGPDHIVQGVEVVPNDTWGYVFANPSNSANWTPEMYNFMVTYMHGGEGVNALP